MIGKNNSEYKPTDNIAADMIGAAITHYKAYHKRIKAIHLRKDYWRIFTDYVQRADPSYPVGDVVNFDNVDIRKGHMFMTKQMHVELYEMKPAEA